MRTRIRWLLFLALAALLGWNVSSTTVEARGHGGGHRGGHHAAHGHHARGHRGAHHGGARARHAGHAHHARHRAAARPGHRAAHRVGPRAGLHRGYAHRGAWGVRHGVWHNNRVVTNRTINRNVNVRRGVGWYGVGRGYWGVGGNYVWPSQYNLYANPATVVVNPWPADFNLNRGGLIAEYMRQNATAQAAVKGAQ